MIANRVLFAVESAGGAFCRGSENRTALQDGNSPLTVQGEFSASQLCWASGVQLERGTRYRIVLDNSGQPWVDLHTPSSTAGFKAHSVAHWLGTPFKRWWSAPWFRPLFLFLNDVGLARPGPTNYFYENNQGGAKVIVEAVRADGQSPHASYRN